MVTEKIVAEETPNPHSLKISVGRPLLTIDGWLEYTRPEDCTNAPLARRLLNYRFAKNIFIRQDFFTLTKHPEYEWEHVISEIREAVDLFLNSGEEASTDAPHVEKGSMYEEESVVSVLRGSIRQATSGDGGEMIFRGMQDGFILVEPFGACRDCPHIQETIEKGLAPAFQKHFGFVLGVRLIEQDF